MTQRPTTDPGPGSETGSSRSDAAPAPSLPRYGSDSLAEIVPALLAPRSARRVPEALAGMDASGPVVLLVLDGLGWLQLAADPARMPTLAAMSGGQATSVAPTTTATALTSITTGLTPNEHGILGYRMLMDDTVMNVLRWGDDSGDLRRRFPPTQVQPCPPFQGRRVPVLSKAELQGTGFTSAHLDGVDPHGWFTPSGIAVSAGTLVREGAPFVYAYYDGIDKVAHAHGLGERYRAEQTWADRLVADILAALPSGATLVVTADHGQVHVGDALCDFPAEVLADTAVMSGEGRFRWLHARRGRAGALLEACREAVGSLAWVASAEQVIEERWFGPAPSAVVRRRYGDVAVAAREAVSFVDPAEAGGFDLVCRHGSLTREEMLVPLLWARV